MTPSVWVLPSQTGLWKLREMGQEPPAMMPVWRGSFYAWERERNWSVSAGCGSQSLYLRPGLPIDPRTFEPAIYELNLAPEIIRAIADIWCAVEGGI